MPAPSPKPRRNPGPSWGYSFLRACDRYLPPALFNGLLWLGSGIALMIMGKQRRYSFEYLRLVLPHKPTILDAWHHFYTFMLSLMELFRLGQGLPHHFSYNESGGEAFERLAQSSEPAFLGTFHIGNSDLLGYAMGRYNRQVRMVRLRMINSNETHWLGNHFAEYLRFIWVDRPENILFELKEAIQSGCSIAMKCDRTETSNKREYFRFLGEEREFPFTIYHLATVFSLPVVFCIGYPDGQGRTLVHASSVFRPDAALSRPANLLAARQHFQGVLEQAETLLQKKPYLWFNFLPLNRSKRESLEATAFRDGFTHAKE
ncbi:MAG: hypothetical protein SFY80_14970 [Verrucomicrobiota bacterium]|nr:hypothetical protein [Verrucomicrobiota bacterium]